MNRYILLDINKKIISVRNGLTIVTGEIQSDLGEMGQIQQTDGSFLDDTTPIVPPVVQPSNLEINTNLMSIMDGLTDIYMALPQ